MKKSILMLCCVQSGLWAQEASSGFELRATISAGASYSHELEEEPRAGGPQAGGFRSVLYPTWKLNKHWTVSGAIQTHSRPYFFEEFYTQGYGVKTDILQAHLSYSNFWKALATPPLCTIPRRQPRNRCHLTRLDQIGRST